MKFVLAGNAQAVFIQSASVLRPANECVDISDTREVRGIEAADRAASNDASSLCHKPPLRETLAQNIAG